MTTLNEEARWARLRDALEDRFTSWQVPYPDAKAEGVVYDLRRSGWRIPLPDFQTRNETWKRRRVLRPEVVRQHAAACREAIRQPDDE